MNTNDIREHLLSKAPWMAQRERTVDTVKVGDATRPVSTVGVGWFASLDDLREAVRLGCDLYITHEPLFWRHDGDDEHNRSVEPGKTKLAFLEETGLVVLRCHDIWDSWPKIGIRDSWAAWLGLGEPVAVSDHPWHAVYAIEPTSLKDFARRVLGKIAPLGEDSVQVIGDGERIVSRPAVGVGCGGPDKDAVDLGADVLIVCYDGAAYWHTRQRLVELGAAVVTVEHGTSEMPGLMNLARYLRETFPGLTVHYIDEHPRTWTVRSGG